MVAIQSDVEATPKYDAFFLIMAAEYFTDSVMVAFVGDAMGTSSNKVMTVGSYGSVRNFWAYCKACTDTDLITTQWNEMAFVGKKGTKGTVGSADITDGGTSAAPVPAFTTSVFSDQTDASSGIVQISAPTGGVL